MAEETTTENASVEKAKKPKTTLPLVATVKVESEEQYELLSGLIESTEALQDMVFRPFDTKKQARIIISGQEVLKGTKEQMEDRYNQETAMSNRINIAAQEMLNGKWVNFKSRRHRTL